MPLVDRSESVLVVVDTQPAFVHVRSRTESESVEAAETVERMAWLATIARILEIPAVVVEEGADRNGSTDPSVLKRLPPKTPVLAKTTFGLAESGEIVDTIRALDRGTVVLMGFDTDVCVAQSALGLQREGFRPVVVADAVYSSQKVHHHHGLERLRDGGIERNHCRGLAWVWVRKIALLNQFMDATHELGRPPLGTRRWV
jgi:nicotinamidase-related amidase